MLKSPTCDICNKLIEDDDDEDVNDINLSDDNSEEMEEEEEEEEDNEEYKYVGEVDINGNKCGRGRLYDNNNKLIFMGRFLNNNKNGKGCYYFEDGSTLKGMWQDNNINGYAIYTAADGHTIEGIYDENGELNELVIEKHFDGKILFEGLYKNNMRHGGGKCYSLDGSIYFGNWQNGYLNGICEFQYQPHCSLIIHGEWVNGDMKVGRCNNSEVVYQYEPSCQHQLCQHPLVADPYESINVYVKKSELTNAGEGLFAKVFIPKNTICAYYNGIRLNQEDVDNRNWSLNDNTITLLEHTPKSGICLDIPNKYSNLKQYCATLGHKANHSFKANAKYSPCEHPRFGHIMCVRSICDIRINEEITVNYGYDINDCPHWYRMNK